MCTVSWLRSSAGFVLHFNRDESLDRAEGLGPVVRHMGGLLAAHPLDAEAGGSWIGVNSRGLALCLLNHYPAPGDDPELWISRGRIVPALLPAADRFRALERLEASRLERHRPFRLLCIEPGCPVACATWSDGELDVRELHDAQRPLVSSPKEDTLALDRRRALHGLAAEAGGIRESTLARFHASHAPERGPRSPCAHAVEYGTVSHTRVAVDEHEVVLEYTPGAPCEAGPTERVSFSLGASAPSGGAGRG